MIWLEAIGGAVVSLAMFWACFTCPPEGDGE